MCGITAIFDIKGDVGTLRTKALGMSRKIRHRGPDWSGIYCGRSAILCHERLSIVDPQSGGQPLFSPDRKQQTGVFPAKKAAVENSRANSQFSPG